MRIAIALSSRYRIGAALLRAHGAEGDDRALYDGVGKRAVARTALDRVVADKTKVHQVDVRAGTGFVEPDLLITSALGIGMPLEDSTEREADERVRGTVCEYAASGGLWTFAEAPALAPSRKGHVELEADPPRTCRVRAPEKDELGCRLDPGGDLIEEDVADLDLMRIDPSLSVQGISESKRKFLVTRRVRDEVATRRARLCSHIQIIPHLSDDCSRRTHTVETVRRHERMGFVDVTCRTSAADQGALDEMPELAERLAIGRPD